jgi:acyl dehydratase
MKPLILVASSSNFPVSPFGLIHVRQRIKVHEPLDVILKEKIDLQATVSRVERVEKGIEVDVTCRVFLNRTDVCIWEGITTVLSRSRETLSRAQGKGAVRDIIRPDNGCLPRGYQVFSVAESTGLKYAVITGDYNPHHLYPWTAKWLGYKKPIAHGMWTLQRALQSVKGMCPREIGSGPMIIDCSFKRPLFMPSRIKVNFWRTLQENCLRLVVTNAELETDLHLDVHVRTL